MTSTELAGTTALVTGATSGIGRATSVLLADRGAHVLVSGRDAARGDAVVAEIRAAGGKADFVAAELGDAASVRTLARDAVISAAERRHPGQQRRHLPLRPNA